MSYIAAIIFNQDLDADDDMSKYILQASLDGRLKSNEGFLSATGDLCSLTAASGKDLYLSAAKITFFANAKTGAGSFANEAVLKVNGTVVETSKISIVATTNAGGGASGAGSSSVVYEFKNIGQKVAATQILKIEVITISSDVDIEGMIQAIEVPSGENPVTYTGS